MLNVGRPRWEQTQAMNDFEYALTLARGFAPARPVALARCDVVELRRQTLNSGQRDAQADLFERKSSEAHEAKNSSNRTARLGHADR
jgi:hypothetical protein